MTRVVVTVNGFVPSTGGPMIEWVELAEVLRPPTEQLTPSPLGCTPFDPPFVTFRQYSAAVDFTAEVGSRLFDALVASQAVATQVTLAIAQQAPLYINDRSPGAQALPWETLCRSCDKFFLTLDGQLPLGRMVGQVEAQPLAQHWFDPPLRVLAVLAAAGGEKKMTAMDEWVQLARALQGQSTIPWRLQVVGCDQDVQIAVETAAAAGQPVEFNYLVSADTVAEAVREMRPHVLHVFSHGFVEPEPMVELATRSDQAARLERGSIVLDRRAFEEIRRDDPSLWLVTLNCCLGGAASDAGQSLGRQVVRAGVPASVSMQEAVDRRDAHAFCGHLYRSLLTNLATAMAASPPPWSLVWPRVLNEPRRRLFAAHKPEHLAPAHCKEWALPVVYEHPVPFRLIGRISAALSPARVAKLLAEHETLQQLRVELARLESPPTGALPGIDERLEGIEAELSAP